MQVATDRAVSIKEAAVRLGVSERTILRMIEAGEIIAFKVLRQWRIRESEIERIMRQSQNQEENN